jgi:diguanylate cyclase (GGDEF)-like protein
MGTLEVEPVKEVVESQPKAAPQRLPEPAYQSRFHAIERRDWWLWALSTLVILTLTAAVVILALPMISAEKGLWARLSLEHAVRGLVGAVLIFAIYALHQQFALKRVRGHLEKEILVNLDLKGRAEWFEQLSTSDPLTRLPNRRFVTEQLRQEIARAQRYGRQLAVVLFDLDRFKQINEHYGRPVGDELLRQFARMLQDKMRSSDTAARYGGDEFLVILPESTEAQAKHFLKRVGKSAGVNADGRKIQVSIRAGRAGYTEGDSVETLLGRADQSLHTEAGHE